MLGFEHALEWKHPPHHPPPTTGGTGSDAERTLAVPPRTDTAPNPPPKPEAWPEASPPMQQSLHVGDACWALNTRKGGITHLTTHQFTSLYTFNSLFTLIIHPPQPFSHNPPPVHPRSALL